MLNKNKSVELYLGYISYLLTFEMPIGWRETKLATTNPNGSKWINNGYSMFEKNEHGTRKHCSALYVYDIPTFKRSQMFKNGKIKKLGYETYAMNLPPKGLTQ